MRKYLFIGLFGLLPLVSFAQKLLVGAGLSVSKVNYNTYLVMGNSVQEYRTQFTDPAMLPSISFGFQYWEQDRFSIASTINLYQTGGKLSAAELYNLGRQSRKPAYELIKFSYVSLNNTFNYLLLNKAIKVAVKAGPRIDFLLANNTEWLEETQNNINQINYGLSVGLGIYYDINRYQVGFEALKFERVYWLINYPQPNVANQTVFDSIDLRENPLLLNLVVGYKLQNTR